MNNPVKILCSIESIYERDLNYIKNKKTKIKNFLDNIFESNEVDFIDYNDLNKKSYDSYDFLIISGGNTMIGSKESKKRDDFELELIDVFKNKNIPILGICRGHQLIGKYCGLKVLNIKEKNIKHFFENEGKTVPTFHEITIHSDVFDNYFNSLHIQMATDLFCNVNSIHKQYIDFKKNKAKHNLNVLASSHDNIPEIIVGDGLMGFQFHPENIENFKKLDIIKSYKESVFFIKDKIINEKYNIYLNEDIIDRKNFNYNINIFYDMIWMFFKKYK